MVVVVVTTLLRVSRGETDCKKHIRGGVHRRCQHQRGPLLVVHGQREDRECWSKCLTLVSPGLIQAPTEPKQGGLFSACQAGQGGRREQRRGCAVDHQPRIQADQGEKHALRAVEYDQSALRVDWNSDHRSIFASSSPSSVCTLRFRA